MLQLQRDEGGFIPFAVKQDHIAAVSILKVADIIFLQTSSSSSSSSSVWDIIERFDTAIGMLNSLSTPSYDNISTFIATVINSGSTDSSGDFLSALLAITFQKFVTKHNQQGTTSITILSILLP